MKNLTLILFACAMLAVGACGSDSDGGGGDNPFADSGSGDASTGDAGMDDTSPDANTCENPCTTSRECAAVGGTCQDGCCVESDGGGGDGGGTTGCGDITFEGECDGSVVRWCNNGALQELDCATWVPGLTGSCEFISDSFGFYCAFPPTSACLVDDGQGGITPLLCTGTEPACELDGETATCVENIGSCTAPSQQGQTFARTCIGEFLAVDCNVVQPIGFDCVALGGTCGGEACVGIPADGRCDGDQLVCADGFDCEGASDTAFGTCVEREATCDDGIQNGDEEGIDCGGSCDTECPAEPTCEDGIQNGDEEGIDCGGETCEACAVEPTCDDGIQNGDELAIDCGGETCDACECLMNDDCESLNCDETTGTCIPASCEDGVQNQDELAIDCGGAICEECGCVVDDDCESLSCDFVTGECLDATCDDGIQNGDEEDIDCGGFCDPCDGFEEEFE